MQSSFWANCEICISSRTYAGCCPNRARRARRNDGLRLAVARPVRVLIATSNASLRSALRSLRFDGAGPRHRPLKSRGAVDHRRKYRSARRRAVARRRRFQGQQVRCDRFFPRPKSCSPIFSKSRVTRSGSRAESRTNVVRKRPVARESLKHVPCRASNSIAAELSALRHTNQNDARTHSIRTTRSSHQC